MRTVAEISQAVRTEDGADVVALLGAVYSTLTIGIHSAMFELEVQLNDIRAEARLAPYDRDFGPWPVRGFGGDDDEGDDWPTLRLVRDDDEGD
jgi:hypothetical protein